MHSLGMSDNSHVFLTSADEFDGYPNERVDSFRNTDARGELDDEMNVETCHGHNELGM